MNVRYRVTLSESERTHLHALVTAGRPAVREVKRAQILLAAADGVPEERIATTVRTSAATIYRTKRCFVEEGLDAALHDAQHPGGARKLSGPEAALLVATACSTPPKDTHGGPWIYWRTRWCASRTTTRSAGTRWAVASRRTN
jgi:transposase